MFNDARPKAFTSINSIIKVEENLKRIAEKFRTADASYDGNLEEGAMCGKLNSEKNDGFLRDKVWHGLKETYEDLSKVKIPMSLYMINLNMVSMQRIKM